MDDKENLGRCFLLRVFRYVHWRPWTAHAIVVSKVRENHLVESNMEVGGQIGGWQELENLKVLRIMPSTTLPQEPSSHWLCIDSRFLLDRILSSCARER